MPDDESKDDSPRVRKLRKRPDFVFDARAARRQSALQPEASESLGTHAEATQPQRSELPASTQPLSATEKDRQEARAADTDRTSEGSSDIRRQEEEEDQSNGCSIGQPTQLQCDGTQAADTSRASEGSPEIQQQKEEDQSYGCSIGQPTQLQGNSMFQQTQLQGPGHDSMFQATQMQGDTVQMTQAQGVAASKLSSSETTPYRSRLSQLRRPRQHRVLLLAVAPAIRLSVYSSIS